MDKTKVRLAPSVMCCDFFRLGEQVKVFEQEGIELLHIDVMDGSFVPNLALGTDFIKQLKKKTSIPLDVHLMVQTPERILSAFPFGDGDMVSVHLESTPDVRPALAEIARRGAKPFLALNPATPVGKCKDYLALIGGLLIMGVNPGFAGQKLMPGTIEKIAGARKLLDENGRPDAEIEADGNVSPENAVLMRRAGANIFVGGTSAVFCGSDLSQNIRQFKKTVFE